jgi:hypothetical protein
MRGVRIGAALIAAVLFTPGIAFAAAERGGGSGGLRFAKAVPLDAFSPVRTATGYAYSISDGRETSEHEWSAEPVIQVGKDGTIYIAGTCCVVASSPVWYSRNGKKFEEMTSPGHVREWGIGAEGDLAVDDEGHVYFVDTYIPGLLFSRWTDSGKDAPAWDYTIPTTGVVPGFDDRPWLALSDKGIYLYVNHVSHTAVYLSTDGGVTWTGEGPLSWNGSSLGQPYFPGHVAAHRKSGTLWVSGVVQNEDGKPVIGSAVSKDQGQTFTEAIVSEPQLKGGFSPIFTGTTAVDEAGNGYVTWSTWDQHGCDVYYAASTNEGKSWGKPVKVSSGPGCATFPWITAGEDGKVALAWYQTPETKEATLAEQFVRAATAGHVLYGGIEVPLFAYQDELPADAPWYLHAAIVRNATAQRPNVAETRVPTKKPVLLGPMGRELWDFLQLDIDRTGRVHITFADKYKDSAPQTWYVGSKTRF